MKILQANSKLQFTQQELATLLQKHKTTVSLAIKQLKESNQIIVKKVGKYTLIRFNDPLREPIPHKIEEISFKPRVESINDDKMISETTRNDFQIKNRRIYVPKDIRDYLKWEEGEKVLFIEKDDELYLEIK